MRFSYPILCISLFLFSCSNEKSKEQQIPMEKLKIVVWQLMKADELYTRKSQADTTWKNEKKNLQFYQQIFELNKIDKVQFYKQMDYLKTRPAEYKELIDSVNEVSKREKISVDKLIKKV
jgi:hypothetical protein